VNSGGGGSGGAPSEGNGGGQEAPPPTSAPVAEPSNGSGNGDGGTTTTTTASVQLLNFVVQYDAAQQSESQVMESLNANLFDGFSQEYPTTKQVRLAPQDTTAQSARNGAETRRRRSLQETTTSVSGSVVFDVSGDQPVPSADEVHSLQTTLLQEWQQTTATGTVTFPEAQGPATNPNGGSSSSSASQSASGGSSNAGTIAGVVVALLVVAVIAATLVVRRNRRRDTPSSSRDRDHLQVEILSEINDGSQYGDDLNGIREKRSMEHAECDIEIEQLDGSKGGGVVMVTTSPTSVAYAQFTPSDDGSSSNNGSNNPDSVFLASSTPDALSVASRGGVSLSTTVAASLTDTETKKGQNRALASLRTFFARQSKKDDAASVASSITSPRPIQWIEPEEKKDEEDVEVALPTPSALLTPPSPSSPSSPVSPFAAVSPSASIDSMEDYSLASASYGPQQPNLHHPAASKWIAPARARVLSAESYHSDTESMFTSEGVGGAGGASTISEAAVLAPSLPPIQSNPLGRTKSEEVEDVEDRSVDEIMGRSTRRTPTRTSKVVAQKASPTSVAAAIESPPKIKSSWLSAARRGGAAVGTEPDEQEPFDEILEDEQDLEVFAAELERAKSRPTMFPPARAVASAGGGSTSDAALLKPAVSTDSHGNSSGAHEETLAGYLRHKVGEARQSRNETAPIPSKRMFAKAKGAAAL
jgi:hypothetical protein